MRKIKSKKRMNHFEKTLFRADQAAKQSQRIERLFRARKRSGF